MDFNVMQSKKILINKLKIQKPRKMLNMENVWRFKITEVIYQVESARCFLQIILLAILLLIQREKMYFPLVCKQ